MPNVIIRPPYNLSEGLFLELANAIHQVCERLHYTPSHVMQEPTFTKYAIDGRPPAPVSETVTKVRIEWYPGKDEATHHAMAVGVAQAVAETLGVAPETVETKIEDLQYIGSTFLEAPKPA